MNKKYGFTLAEIVIAIVIVGILSIVAVPVYKGYVKRGISTEGRSLLSDINVGQQSYYYRKGKYYDANVNNEQHNAILGVDARTNKYFTSYSKISVDNSSFIYRTNEYNGLAITIRGSVTQKPEIFDPFTPN